MADPNTKQDRHTPSVPAAERVLSILELAATTRRGLALGELCHKLDLPKSSCHCLIVTLERRGYLFRNPATHRYVVGPKLFSLGSAALNGTTLREQSAPFLRMLMEQTGLTVHLAIPSNGTAVLIEKIPPPGLLQLATWVGKRFDLHCAGVGKALLAYLPEADFVMLTRNRLTRYNENTIISPRSLSKELALIRQRGYALEDEEGELGYRCIGAPIFDHSGTVVAAVSIAGSVHQITDANLSANAQKVITIAHSISAVMGHHEPDNIPSK